MTLTELRYVTVLAKTQHFGQAAEQCHVSQPTLSIAIKKLESELGVELFERTTTHILVTRIGEKIITQAQKILDEAIIIKDIAITEGDPLNSSLHIGAIFTVGPYLFPNFVPSLQKIAPNMRLVIEEGYTNTQRKRLRKGEVDVVILSLPFEEPDVAVQPLFDEPFMAILPPDHPLTKHAMLEPKDLETEHILLLGEDHCFRDQVIEAIPNINKHYNSTVSMDHDSEGNSIETLCAMVAIGLGITVLPQTAVTASSFAATNLVAIPFKGNGPKRTIALAWRASFPRHQAIDAVRKAIFAGRKISADDKKPLPDLSAD